jgi:hypothetical protein
MVTVLLGIVALLILSAFGLAMLALLSEQLRRRYLPAAPLFGVIYLVVVGYLLQLVLPASISAWIAVALAAALLVVGLRLHRPRLRSYRRALLGLGLVLAVGLVAALIAWTPSFLVNNWQTIMPSASHDAFWYVASSVWMQGHTLLQMPQIGMSPGTGTDAVFFGPPVEAFRNSTRLGQEMVMGDISVLTGIPVVAGFSAWQGVWAMLGASGAWLFGEAVRLPVRWRLVGGLLLSVSASLALQTTVQNADSILGLALVLAAIGLTGAALTTARRTDRAPLWLAGAAVAAALGVYSEYLPFLAVSLVALVLVWRLRDLRPRLERSILVLIASVVLGPAIWFRAVSALLFVGSIASSGGGQTGAAAVLSLLGPVGRAVLEGEGAVRILAIAASLGIAAVVAVGLVAGLASRRYRGVVIGSGVLTLLLATYLTVTANPYIAHRAADMIAPLVALAALCGWVALFEGSGLTRFRVPVRAVSVIAVVAVIAANLALAGHAVASRIWNDRVVTVDFELAGEWVEEFGGDAGSSVTVAAPYLFDQLWLSEALSGEPDVAWANLRGDLGYRSNGHITAFWDGENDRYLLVGPGALASSGADALRASARFSLFDLQNSSVVVAVPDSTDGAWQYARNERGGIAASGPAALVMFAGAQRVGVAVVGVSGLAPGVPVAVTVDGSEQTFPVDSSGRASLVLPDLPFGATSVFVAAPGGFVLNSIEVRP